MSVGLVPVNINIRLTVTDRRICSMVKGRMIFCAVVGKIVRARIQKEAEFTLSFAAAEPVVLYVHGFCLALNYGVVRYTHGSGFISLDGGFRLRPTHSDKGIPKWNHGLGTDE